MLKDIHYEEGNCPGKLKDAVINKEQWEVKILSKPKSYGLYKRISCGVQNM